MIGPCFFPSVERHLNRPAIDHIHQGREWVNRRATLRAFVLLTALSVFHSAPQEPCNANSTPHSWVNNRKGGGRSIGAYLEVCTEREQSDEFKESVKLAPPAVTLAFD
ncbi:hypothetical protein NQZ68_027354 [Dissostichus eleginoides]|nr:hypothetical protein NQZ68_027354 [Dissostichus eleginoides]